ncbi:MAG: glycyl-radical enzyme activating protein [Planctomycetia bacterium]|nr:glycyl-radical enzyme activating protein [Planctomycetia bacterium]
MTDRPGAEVSSADHGGQSPASSESHDVSRGESKPVPGTIFEIREFTLHDGPGIRTSVFFKGCPLRCLWCHNPEGQSQRPELLVNSSVCTHCGGCRKVCPVGTDPDACTVCGRCTQVCPQNARRLCGESITGQELVAKLLRRRDLYTLSGGGVTLTGGEPLAQPDFAADVARRLRVAGVHVALETCGWADHAAYQKLVHEVQLVYQDIKVVDRQRHRKLTGRDNTLILENLHWLERSGTAYVIRVPLIPGLNDSQEDLKAVAARLSPSPGLVAVELIPYNIAAGAKYHLLQKAYPLRNLTFPQTKQEQCETTTSDPLLKPFIDRGITARHY